MVRRQAGRAGPPDPPQPQERDGKFCTTTVRRQSGLGRRTRRACQHATFCCTPKDRAAAKKPHIYLGILGLFRFHADPWPPPLLDLTISPPSSVIQRLAHAAASSPGPPRAAGSAIQGGYHQDHASSVSPSSSAAGVELMRGQGVAPRPGLRLVLWLTNGLIHANLRTV